MSTISAQLSCASCVRLDAQGWLHSATLRPPNRGTHARENADVYSPRTATPVPMIGSQSNLDNDASLLPDPDSGGFPGSPLFSSGGEEEGLPASLTWSQSHSSALGGCRYFSRTRVQYLGYSIIHPHRQAGRRSGSTDTNDCSSRRVRASALWC